MENLWSELEYLYPELNETEYREIVKDKIHFKKMDSGEMVGSIGSGCSDFLFIVKGTMKIERVDQNGRVTKLYELGPGELCHDFLSCYMGWETLNLSAWAITDMTVAMLPSKLLQKYLLNDIGFMKKAYSKLYDKFRKIVLSKEKIIHESILNRLVCYLLDKNSENIYITHQEIAYDLSSAREVISKNLKKIEKLGLIKMERNKIKILNRQGLLSIKND